MKRRSLSNLGYILLMATVILCDIYFIWLAPKGRLSSTIYIAGLVGLLIYLGIEIALRRRGKAEQAGETLVAKRLKRSIEHLKHEKPEVRLVAMHRIEKLGKQTDPEQAEVKDALTAYLRETSSLREDKGHQLSDLDDDVQEDRPCAEVVNAPKDAQAILDLIGRFESNDKLANGSQWINLSRTNLQRVNLFDANLEDANLSEADLEGANLWSANLKNVSLRKANLKNANLFEAHLKDANFAGANLEDSKLWEANLEGADLTGANLKGADLRGAKLEKAILPAGNLDNTKYNHKTTFPKWLDQKKRDELGMVFEIE